MFVADFGRGLSVQQARAAQREDQEGALESSQSTDSSSRALLVHKFQSLERSQPTDFRALNSQILAVERSRPTDSSLALCL